MKTVLEQVKQGWNKEKRNCLKNKIGYYIIRTLQFKFKENSKIYKEYKTFSDNKTLGPLQDV